MATDADGISKVSLRLATLPEILTIARFGVHRPPPAWVTDLMTNTAVPFVSITRTAEEVSVVAPTGALLQIEEFERQRAQLEVDVEEACPGLGWSSKEEEVKLEGGWRLMAVQGPLDFSLVGILAGLSKVLAAARVSIFVISTYDTDMLMVKDESLDAAVAALTKAGHTVFAPPALPIERYPTRVIGPGKVDPLQTAPPGAPPSIADQIARAQAAYAGGAPPETALSRKKRAQLAGVVVVAAVLTATALRFGRRP